jgi:hypothetical protein
LGSWQEASWKWKLVWFVTAHKSFACSNIPQMCLGYPQWGASASPSSSSVMTPYRYSICSTYYVITAPKFQASFYCKGNICPKFEVKLFLSKLFRFLL